MFGDSSLTTVCVLSLGDDCRRCRRKEKQKDGPETAPERVLAVRIGSAVLFEPGIGVTLSKGNFVIPTIACGKRLPALH